LKNAGLIILIRIEGFIPRGSAARYVDFYLLHNVCEIAWDFYTGKEISVVDYLLEEKKVGRIKHLGFSAHCRPETLERFLRLYPCFEFVQIQLNYLGWTLQEAKRKYDIITSRGIPVWVMEPCRGGRLANNVKTFSDDTPLPAEEQKALDEKRAILG
jgi:predicted aldo/keto reductase-like oxidoreductase